MRTALTTHIFIDTNVAMHYQRPDQIDWTKLLATERVVLVGAPVLLSELEKQKIHNDSRKLRERADAYIKWLIAFVRDPSKEVRPGVSWHLIANEPMLDFTSVGLSRDIADDHLIASVLSYTPDDGGDICVATVDIGLEVKLRARQIVPFPLQDDLRLPSEPDPMEKELQAFRRQAAQKRAPVLALTWTNKAAHCKIAPRRVITRPSAKSLEEMRSRIPFLKKPKPRAAEANSVTADLASIGSDLANTFRPPQRIDRYNQELEVYFSKYETYLEELLEWEIQRSLREPIGVVLSNKGNAPASQIDVMLTFPGDIVLLEKDDLSKKPQAPEVPRKPETDLTRLFSPGVFASPLIVPPHVYRPPASARDGDPNIGSNGHDVSFEIPTLKHLFTFSLGGGCYFCFPEIEAVRSFQVQYHVSAAELPEAIEGSLHIVLDGQNG